jgi:S-adenosylhomocysteine hydrolase
VPFVSQLINLGCDKNGVAVVGIPYSTKPGVCAAVNALGCRTYWPETYPFDAIVAKALLDICQKADQEDRRVLIIEDGCYVVSALGQLNAAGLLGTGSIVGAVEQTSRGAWIARDLRDKGLLQIPVIEIPSCQTKKVVEPVYIAESVASNLDAVLALAKVGDIRTAGLYGYGTIGDKVANLLKSRGVDVLVHDPHPDNKFSALIRSHFGHLGPNEIERCDLIIGATGTTSINQDTILRSKDRALFASVSSRRVEVDTDYLERRTLLESRSTTVGGSMLRCPAFSDFRVNRNRESKIVRLLYDGYPVNFWGHSLPDYVGDAVMSLLLSGCIALASGSFSGPAVLPGHEVIEQDDWEIYQEFKSLKPDDGQTFD